MTPFEQLVLVLLLVDTSLITVGFIFCKDMVNRTPEESAEHIIKTEKILKQKGDPL